MSALTLPGICSIAGIFLVTVLAMFVSYDVFRTYNAVRGEETVITAMVYAEALLILSHMVIVATSYFFVSDPERCTVIGRASCFLFHLTTALLYLILVKRMQIVFQLRGRTVIEFTKRRIFALHGLIALCSLPFLLYIDPFVVESEFTDNFGCAIRRDLAFSILMLIGVAMHCVVAVCALHLFLQQILDVTRSIDCLNREEINRPLYLINIKTSILYSAAIFSSLLLILLYLTTDSWFHYSVCHSFINGAVLLLTDPMHNMVFNKVCCGPKYLCTRALDLRLRSEAEKKSRNEPVVASSKPPPISSEPKEVPSKPPSKPKESEEEEIPSNPAGSEEDGTPKQKEPPPIVTDVLSLSVTPLAMTPRFKSNDGSTDIDLTKITTEPAAAMEFAQTLSCLQITDIAPSLWSTSSDTLLVAALWSSHGTTFISRRILEVDTSTLYLSTTAGSDPDPLNALQSLAESLALSFERAVIATLEVMKSESDSL